MIKPFDAVIVADSINRLNAVGRAVGPLASLRFVNLDGRGLPPGADFRVGIVSIDLAQHRSVERYRVLSSTLGLDSKPRLFAASRASHRDIVQSYSLGASEIVGLPIDSRSLVDRIHTIIDDQKAGETPPMGTVPIATARGADLLRDLLHATRFGTPLPGDSVTSVAGGLVDSLLEYPIDRWLGIMRAHHHQSFEHALTATGTAVSFGLTIGFGRSDLVRLAAAALVYDLGMAFVPATIVSKPETLDPDEVKLVRMHTQLGHAALKQMPKTDDDLLDAALNHHEYLDGTGYPRGIGGRAISDLCRIITMCDAYSAMIERRAYKRDMHPSEAYRQLEAMEGKLDGALVRAFKPVARRLARLRSL